MADDLAPHPLVVQVGIGLSNDDKDLKAAVVTLEKGGEGGRCPAARRSPRHRFWPMTPPRATRRPRWPNWSQPGST